ncbi:MAG: hypothetical protein IJX78_01950 [Bacilli bacterium]|nr:hypothetical protein [Bacilli bacterium]
MKNNKNRSNSILIFFRTIKWYEYLLASLIPILIIIWGNTIVLCELFPIVGAIYGIPISLVFLILVLVLFKKVKTVVGKVFLGLGMMASAFLVSCLAYWLILYIW